MDERYWLIITHEDDTTLELTGLTLEETLQVMLEEVQQPGAVWFKVETI